MAFIALVPPTVRNPIEIDYLGDVYLDAAPSVLVVSDL